MKHIAQKVLYHYLGHIPKSRPFVFGIGLSKTATTSLNDALEILGIPAYHLPPSARVVDQDQIQLDWPWWLSKFHAATDLTVAATFLDLKAEFPNARFIYTTRDIDKWLESCRRHFTLDMAARRVRQKNFLQLELPQAFYGSFLYDEALYRAAYEAHDKAVREAFSGAKNFIVFDLTKHAEWEPLCTFLGCPVPQQPFPFSNRNKNTS